MARSLRVLILEDQADDAELLIRELRQHGFDPDWKRVATKDQVLAHLRPDLDVILAGYTLPSLDAVEALHLLRERKLDVPFIVVTEAVGEEAAAACLRQGADDYLLKDRLVRLGPAVEQAIAAKRLRDQRRAAERETRVSARQWQATFDAISDPVFLLDAGGRIARCNQAALTFAGQQLAPLVGRSCCEVVQGASGPTQDCPYRRALETQRREARVWQRGHRWFRAVVDPMVDDEDYLVGFVYVLDDITERKRMEESLRRRNRELSLLNQAGQTLNASLQLEEVLGTVLEEVRGLLGVVGCSAWLWDLEAGDLVCRQATGPQSEFTRGWRLAPGEGLVGWVLEHGESLIVPDARRDTRHFKGVDQETGLPIRSLLGVPLQVEDRVIGVLEAVDTAPGRFDHRDLRLLEALASFAANAIQNARLYEQAELEIAERHRAEQALRKSEERFRTVVGTINEGLMIMDEAGHFTYVNQRACEMLGYTRDELLGTHHLDVVAEEHRQRHAQRFVERKRGEPEVYETLLRRKDGESIPVILAGSPLTDQEGVFRGTVGTFTDITERKQAEEALQESERRFRLLFEEAPLAYQSLDEDGQLLEVNQAWLDLLGYDRKDVIGRWFGEFIVSEQRERFKASFSRFKAAGEVHDVEYSLFRQDGSSVIVVLDGTIGHDEQGNFRQTHCTMRDVTAWKHAQQALQESEERFRSLVESSSDHIFMLEPDGTYLTSNRRLSHFGLEGDGSLVGRHLCDAHPPDVAKFYQQKLEQVLATGESVSFEHPMLDADGAHHHHVDTLYPVRRHGDIWAVGGICRDITERRRAQEQLRRRADQLRAINELAVDLASSGSVRECFHLIADKLKAITGTLAVSVSTYDALEQQLEVEHVAAEGWLVSRVNKLLERRIVGWRMPVSEETRARMLDEVVTTAPDLSETTFGTVSKPVASTIQRALGIDRFVGLALVDGDDLLGTSVLVFPPEQPAPSEEVLKLFARVAAASLRQQQAEEALHRVTEERRVVLDLVPVGISITDEQGQIIESNQMSEEILGVPLADHKGRRYDGEEWPIVRPDGTPMPSEAYASFRALEDQRTVRNKEMGIVRPDGDVTWISVSAAPLPLEGYGVAIAYADVTERKHAEERLQESEAFLRQVIDTSPNCIFVKDWDGTYILVNRAIADLYDTTKEEMLGKTDRELVGLDRLSPDEAERFLADDRQVMREGERKVIPEESFTLADGTTRWFQTIKGPLTTSLAPRCMLGVAVDITKRKRAEEALRERITELQLLSQVESQVAAELDLDALLERAVRLVQEAFGYYQVAIMTVDQDRDELIVSAMTGGFADLIPDDYRQGLDEGLIGWAARHREALLVNDVESDPRYVNHYPDQVRTQSELSIPILVGGQVAGVLDLQSKHRDAFDENDLLVIGTLADQIAVAMENARLYEKERAAQDCLRELADYLQEAQETERTRIAREIHDEFGQMMTVLKMDLAWLRKRFPENEPPLRRKVDAMSDLVDRSLEIVRRLSSELRPGILDDLGLAAAIEWQAEAFSDRSRIACQLDLDETADRLNCDLSTALFRIFQEALTNVARHAQATEVHVELRVDPEEVTLIVEDDGRGIAPDEISGSSSLGLLGMRERARALGGEIIVAGVPDQGTTVTARIPNHE